MPFIEPRLGAKTVDSIWTEAASGDLTLCPKCEDVAEPVGGGKRQCISCYHTFTPKTSAAAPDGQAAFGGGTWCNNCYGVTSTSGGECVTCGKPKSADESPA